MKINLNTLNKPVEIDNDFVIPQELYENMRIKEIRDVHAKGRVYYNISDEVEIDLLAEGLMIIPDAITLEELMIPFSFKIEEIVAENEEYLKNNENILDIIEILWENIVLEVPISVTESSGVQKSGKGWELNGNKKDEEIDPRLEKLNDIFKGGE